MTVSVLFSTLPSASTSLERSLSDLAQQTVMPEEVITVIQGPKDSAYATELARTLSDWTGRLNIKVIRSHTVGLAVSRNIALRAASSEVALFADDDCRYPRTAIEKVQAAFVERPNAAAITFQVTTTQQDSAFKRYEMSSFDHTMRSAQRINSVSLAVRLRSLGSVLFDEAFGAGTKWPSCAENIFVTDLMKQGKRVTYVPDVVVSHDEVSSGQRLGSNKVASAKGAAFTRMFGRASSIAMLAFVLRKWRKLPSPLRFMACMIEGRQQYLRLASARAPGSDGDR